jgi:hypothetical protein
MTSQISQVWIKTKVHHHQGRDRRQLVNHREKESESVEVDREKDVEDPEREVEADPDRLGVVEVSEEIGIIGK